MSEGSEQPDISGSLALEKDDEEMRERFAAQGLQLTVPDDDPDVAFDLTQSQLKDVTLSDDTRVQSVRIRELAHAIGLDQFKLDTNEKTQLHAAIAAVRDLKPQDEQERTIAYLLVAMNHAAGYALHNVNDKESHSLLRNQAFAQASKAIAGSLKCSQALDSHRNKGKQEIQVITKYETNVNDGGQAVIGDGAPDAMRSRLADETNGRVRPEKANRVRSRNRPPERPRE
ncbi:MAG: hypothetical protein AAFQ64_15115 [Pseudomonadota bacterium]